MVILEYCLLVFNACRLGHPDSEIKCMVFFASKIVSMIRKYHNHKAQTNKWHHEEEPHNNHETPGRQTKQSNQLSLPNQDDCKTKMDIQQRITKHRIITDSRIGSNNKQRINNNRTTALEHTAAEATSGGGGGA